MQKCTCPSCGASVFFQSRSSILAVCEYCGSSLVRHDLNLENVGKMAELQADGSPLQLRVAGRYGGGSFTVVGRIQLRYEKGLWNEWHLLFDDLRSGWLGEAGGTYAVSFLTNIHDALPRFENLHPGDRVILKGQSYEVTQVEQAICVAGEGELPSLINPGYSAPAADLAGPGAAFATLDFSEDPPLIFMGEYVEFEQLHLTGLREVNGW